MAQVSRTMTLLPVLVTPPLFLSRLLQRLQQGTTTTLERSDAFVLGAPQQGHKAHDTAVVHHLDAISRFPVILATQFRWNHHPALLRNCDDRHQSTPPLYFPEQKYNISTRSKSLF